MSTSSTATFQTARDSITTTNPEAMPPWVDQVAYPFARRTMRLSAGTVSYVDEGHGDAVLFVHGTPTWSFEYRHLIAALSPAHRCIAADHLGFGLSERPAGFAYTPEAHASVLAELVARLRLDRFTLVVHDYGGPIALPLALADPARIDALVVLNSWMWSLGDDPGFRRTAKLAGGALGRLLYRRFNVSLRTLMPAAFGDRKKLTRDIHAQYLAPFRDADGRGRVLWALARALLGSSEHFDSLWRRRARLASVPALVLWGLRDRALPPTFLARWRAALPHAQVVEMDGAGHWPHEEAPEEVVARIKELLAAT